MELHFLYSPTEDVAAVAAFYENVLGWAEAWRDGETTIAFQIPGSPVQVMVSTTPQPAGPMYLVPDLGCFLSAHPELTVTIAPYEIPGGHNAGVSDPAGNTFYVFELT